MKLQHLGKTPKIHDSVYIAPNAVVCGDVTIGENTRIMFGAAVVAEGGSIVIGDNCVVLENAVLRSTAKHSLKIGSNVLIGPQTHIVGCTIEDDVFIATGSTVFHGARLCRGAEVRVNGIVHIRTVLPENCFVPIGWIALGDPVQMYPPDKHDEIWAVQRPLDFPAFVYGVERELEGQNMTMQKITEIMTNRLGSHLEDTILPEEAES